jgi:hypothetical protein
MRRRRSQARDRTTNWALKELEESRVQMIPAAQQYNFWNPDRISRPQEYHTVDDIPKSKWITWWKLPILHEPRSPWWRFLHDKLLHRQRLHTMDVIKYPSSICPYCKKEDEDDYHFAVDCHLKWEAWRKVLDIVQFPSPYTDPMDIW